MTVVWNWTFIDQPHDLFDLDTRSRAIRGPHVPKAEGVSTASKDPAVRVFFEVEETVVTDFLAEDSQLLVRSGKVAIRIAALFGS